MIESGNRILTHAFVSQSALKYKSQSRVETRQVSCARTTVPGKAGSIRAFPTLTGGGLSGIGRRSLA